MASIVVVMIGMMLVSVKKYGCKTKIIRYYPVIIDDLHPDSHNYDMKCEYNIINNKIIFL
jgi:hypothetical protein